MKNLCFSLVICSVFAVITPLCIYAQSAVKTQAVNNVATITQPAAIIHNSMAAYRNIPIKAVRSFKNTWQYVDNETWYEVPSGYEARFRGDGVLYQASYNKKGKWIKTLRQYDETKLNREVRAQVKSTYYDYNILLVEEIEQSMKPLTYIIHMEDKESFKNIRICDRELEVVNEINKL